jgi:hypothetical protein
MFILDHEQPAETTRVTQLLRTWWARLAESLRRHPRPAPESESAPHGEGRSGGLIL